MYDIIGLINYKKEIKIIAFDFVAMMFIYFIPPLSHLVSFPIYYFEPMRIMLILSIIYTSKNNTYLIALSLPFFTLLISSHPSFYKTLLIALELIVNTFLFHNFLKKTSNLFMLTMISIILSKIFYYCGKYLLIYLLIINTGLISTPIFLQLLTAILLSIFLHKYFFTT